MMTPQTRCRVEAVVLKEPPSVPGQEPDRVDEVAEDRLGDEVVEVDAETQPGLMPSQPWAISRSNS